MYTFIKYIPTITTNGVIYTTVSAICVTTCITMSDYMFYSLYHLFISSFYEILGKESLLP